MKQAGALVHCELKKGRPTLTQVQIGTKGALMSYVARVSSSALLLPPGHLGASLGIFLKEQLSL